MYCTERELRSRLNANIRAEAARRDWTQDDIARETGLSRASVAARFAGRARWSVHELAALSMRWCVSLDMLVSLVRGDEPEQDAA